MEIGVIIGIDVFLLHIHRTFMVLHTIGDIITGEYSEPEVVISASPTIGGLLDSLSGSIGISRRAKPIVAPATTSTTTITAVTVNFTADAPRIGSGPLDKDGLRTFIGSAMPFGTLLDVSYANITTIKISGFSLAELPPADCKQPAWKPYLYKGKQRVLFPIHKTVHAALYDRDEIPESLSASGQVNCRAELEGLPDVMCSLTGLDSAHFELLSFHPCEQVPEHGGDRQGVTFSPPLGNFVLMHYQASCSFGPLDHL